MPRAEKVLIIDAGANAECKPRQSLPFCADGHGVRQGRGVKDPRVGLVTNGTEDHKGIRSTRKRTTF